MVTSVTAARAADSSTIVWSAANVATRTWSARLLVEGGEAPELDPAPQHGLAEEQPGERRDTVHLRIRVNDETPVLLERFRVIGDSLLCE